MADLEFLRPPPAYQEYASDLLADRNYRSMSLVERGLLHTLRLELWVVPTLPGNISDLADLLRIPVEEIEKSFTRRVGAFFEITEHAITCPELDRQKAKLERKRQRQSEGGAIGGLITQGRLRENQANAEGYPEGHPRVRNRKALSRKEPNRADWQREEPKYDSSDYEENGVDDFDQSDNRE